MKEILLVAVTAVVGIVMAQAIGILVDSRPHDIAFDDANNIVWK